MQNEPKSVKSNKNNILMLAFFFVAVPVTLFLSWKYFERNYYVTSLLIIIYSMIPFFAMFEKRKPQARELVTIAVMCAIAVASRAAFIWLPNFKPIFAIIMITGIALGPQAGFLTGALSALTSNFIFGQTPYTPWQMFAFGIAGFAAGQLYKMKLIKSDKKHLSIFGALFVFLIVGPILDTSALFMSASVINKTYILSTYVAGIPINFSQSVATFLTLYLFSEPLLEKINRVKTKYGMMEG